MRSPDLYRQSGLPVAIPASAGSALDAPASKALLDVLFERAGLALCLLGPDLRLRRASPEWLRATRLDARLAVGAELAELFPQHAELARGLAGRARAGEVVVIPRRMDAFRPGDAPVWWEGRVCAVPLPDGVGTLLVAIDVTHELAAREEADGRAALLEAVADRLSRLQRITGSLAASTTPDAVVAALREAGVAACGASACALAWPEDPATLRAEAVAGPAGGAGVIHVPVASERPLARVFRTREPVEWGDAGEARARLPQGLDVLDLAGLQAGEVVPLLAGDRAVGVLALGYDRPPGEAARALRRDLAAQVAQALERARLHEEARALAEGVARLQSATAAFSGAVSQRDVARVVFDQGLALVGADAAQLFGVSEDGTELELLFSHGTPDPEAQRFRRVPLELATPAADAVKTGRPVWLESPAAIDEAYPGLAGMRRACGDQVWVSLPLEARGRRALGALGLAFHRPRALEGRERAFIVALAEQCAQALERARLHAESERARAHAEALAAVGAALSRGLDLDAVLRAALARAVPLLGGADGAVFLAEPGGAAVRGAAEARPRGRVGRLMALAAAPGVTAAIEVGDPRLLAVEDSRDDERAWMDHLGIEAALVVPMVTGGRLVGVLFVDYPQRRDRLQPGDVEFARSVAAAVAAGVTRLRAGDAERRSADRLARLQRVTGAFSAALTPADVARVLFDEGLPAVGAGGAAVLVPSAAGTLAVAHAARPAEAGHAAVAAGGGLPAAIAFRTLRPVWAAAPAEIDALGPQAADARRASGEEACAAIPMVVDGRPTGVVSMTWRRPRALDGEEQRFVAALVDQCAQALERARLLEAERRARTRLSLMTELVAALAAASTAEEVVDVVSSAALDAFGAVAATLALARDGGGLACPAAGRFPGGAAAVGTEAASPVTDAHRRREPVFLESMEAAEARYPELAPARRGAPGALAALPLLVEGGCLGVLAVAFGAPRGFDIEERATLLSLARTCAQALERARLHDAERAARAEAERVGGLQERLLAIVGHDLRTPLSSITIGAKVMFDRGGLDERQAATLARLSRSAQRMAGIIRDLLDFSRARQGLGLVMRPVAANLGEVVRRVLVEFREIHPDREVVLEASGPLDGVFDPERLGQVASNLVGNALRHAGPSARVRVSVRGDGARAELEVWNDGAPIGPSVLPTLFEPFRRGADRDPGEDGIGLGLFIVREIVRAHGGEVTVASGAEGTRFTVALPRRAPGSG